jgi:hypothetical protein
MAAVRTAMVKVQSGAEPTDTLWHKVISYTTINGCIELRSFYVHAFLRICNFREIKSSKCPSFVLRGSQNYTKLVTTALNLWSQFQLLCSVRTVLHTAVYFNHPHRMEPRTWRPYSPVETRYMKTLLCDSVTGYPLHRSVVSEQFFQWHDVISLSVCRLCAPQHTRRAKIALRNVSVGTAPLYGRWYWCRSLKFDMLTYFQNTKPTFSNVVYKQLISMKFCLLFVLRGLNEGHCSK